MNQISDDDFKLLTEVKAILAEADGQKQPRELSTVYIALLRATADAYVLAIRHGENDLRQRYERLHQLLSPHMVLELTRTWLEHQSLLAELDERDRNEAA